MKKLIILGAGGHGKVCGEIAQKMKSWDEILFLDDDYNKINSFPFPIIDKINISYYLSEDTDFFVAIGNNHTRKTLINTVLKYTTNLTTLVDPDAVLSKYTSLGKGVVIMPGVVINGFSSIDKGTIINTSCLVDHDCTIKEFVHISPGAVIGGNCHIGTGTWIGLNSSVINNISITDSVIVGSGAVVVDDIIFPGTYIGVPARRREIS